LKKKLNGEILYIEEILVLKKSLATLTSFWVIAELSGASLSGCCRHTVHENVVHGVNLQTVGKLIIYFVL
jgi:hypothetical protein